MTTLTNEYTLAIDSRLEGTIQRLDAELGGKGKANVMRLAIALLQLSVDARFIGQRLALVDENGNLQSEVILPS